MDARSQAAVDRFDPRPTPIRRGLAWMVAASSQALMRGANRVTLVDAERLDEARATGRGLLTLSNHVSLFDDPWLTACLSGPQWGSLRWIGADAINFFGSPLKAAVFNAGKCVPIVRGAGLDQPGMHFLAERLAQGEWVHFFPEGTRTRREDGAMEPLKSGFAHLVRAARPLVLPFHHQGMRDVLPVGARLPRVGREVIVRFGEAVDTDEGLADRSVEDLVAWAEEVFSSLARKSAEAGPAPV
ncbi:MAG: 1-acyl-sn-glycerol-3-phosphate acyltransferase [Deltaproteobacteria bacterium]|nr:MAG: 1-acyl-sn-glycerol-3-phosphate acyltransferase [Deltaproteobacteria bacterium]